MKLRNWTTFTAEWGQYNILYVIRHNESSPKRKIYSINKYPYQENRTNTYKQLNGEPQTSGKRRQVKPKAHAREEIIKSRN